MSLKRMACRPQERPADALVLLDRLSLQLVVQSATESFSGTLILMEESGEATSNDEAKCLLLQVGGDTLLGISYHAQNREPQRWAPSATGSEPALWFAIC